MFPQTREEYTVWCLSRSQRNTRKMSVSYMTLHTWIKYTITHFPDLVSVAYTKHQFQGQSIVVRICNLYVDTLRPHSIGYTEAKKLLEEGNNESA